VALNPHHVWKVESTPPGATLHLRDGEQQQVLENWAESIAMLERAINHTRI
jgi:uncharacterized protein YlzI (FlbEa/FlbD family)